MEQFQRYGRINGRNREENGVDHYRITDESEEGLNGGSGATIIVTWTTLEEELEFGRGGKGVGRWRGRRMKEEGGGERVSVTSK